MTTLILLVLASFVLGSIPTGFLVAKVKGIDIRSVGSGNIGATNVARGLGKGLGALVFLLDVLKGAIPPLIVKFVLLPMPNIHLEEHALMFVAGTGAVFGHCLSPFMKFKGGKGVATAFGAVLATHPLIAIICISGFIVVFAVTKYVSLASIVGVSSVLIWAPVFGFKELALVTIPTVLLSVARHGANIKRLLKGEESKFSLKKKEPEAS